MIEDKKNIIGSIQDTFAYINDAEKKIKKIEHEITSKSYEIVELLKPFAKQWEPSYNEEAVCFMPERKFAYYVWFTEKFGHRYKFREVPNHYNSIRNYISQDIADLEKNWDFIVIPQNIFHELNQSFKIHIADKSTVPDIF